MKQRILLLALTLLCLTGSITPVFAQTPTPFPTPSLPPLETPPNAAVFRNLIDTTAGGDFLVVFQYRLPYSPVPEGVEVTQTFLVRLLDASGTQIGANTFSMIGHPNLGYIAGVGSVYLSTADAPVWECACVIEVNANPGINGLQSFPKASYTLQSGDFNASSSQAVNRTDLGTWVLDRADAVEALLDPVQVWVTAAGPLGRTLTTAGSNYFNGAIPGLFTMAPQIFQTLSVLPTVIPLAGTPTYNTTLASEDSIIALPLKNFAAQFGMARYGFGFFLALIAMLFVIAGSFKRHGTPTPGAFIGGMSILLLAPIAGFISFQITAVVGFFLILIIAAAMFLLR